MIKYTFSLQSQCVNVCRKATEHLTLIRGVDLTESIEGAKVAETTLAALALIGEKTILRATDLEKVAREIIEMIDRNEGTIHDEEALELRSKLMLILGETTSFTTSFIPGNNGNFVEEKKKDLLDLFRI